MSFGPWGILHAEFAKKLLRAGGPGLIIGKPLAMRAQRYYRHHVRVDEAPGGGIASAMAEKKTLRTVLRVERPVIRHYVASDILWDIMMAQSDRAWIYGALPPASGV